MPRVGSSSRSTGAPPTATAAMATRCRCPPDRLRGCAAARSVRCSASSQWSTAAASVWPRSRCVSSSSRLTVEREQHGVRVLRYVGDARAAVDGPARRRDQVGERAQQGGLPGAVAAEQRDDVAGVQFEVDVAHGRVPAEHDPHAARRDQALAGRRERRRRRGGTRSTGSAAARARASRTVRGSGSQPRSRPSRVTVGAPG